VTNNFWLLNLITNETFSYSVRIKHGKLRTQHAPQLAFETAQLAYESSEPTF